MANSIDVAIGRQISRRIDELYLGRAEVASALGITADQLRLIESGDARASAEALQILAKFLDVPVSYFYDSDDPEDTLH